MAVACICLGQDHKEHTMTLDSYILPADDILPELKATGRKQALQAVVECAARTTGLDGAAILSGLGPWKKDAALSAIGDGVAVLHTALAGLERPYTLFARLPQAVDYNAPDGEFVDLLFVLLSPESDGPLHLQRLSRATRLLRDRHLCRSLRDADTEDTLRALLSCYPADKRLAA